MRDDAVRARQIVVHRAMRIRRCNRARHDSDAHEAGKPPLEDVGVGIDDVDAGVGAVGQIVLATVQIDKADVEGPQRLAWDLNRGQTFGLGVGWGPGTLARRSRQRR